jgi:hypothetical protein
VAAVGDGIAAVALPLIAVRASHGDPLAVASVVAAQHLPWVLVQLAGRARALDRRTLVGLSDTARALGLGILGALVLRNTETILTVQLVAFLVGLGEAWTDRLEAETGAAGVLGPRGMVAVAVVGFPLGGVLYQQVPGPATPLLADVLVFTVASTLALAMRRPVRPPDGSPSPPSPPPGSGTGRAEAGGSSAALTLLTSAAAASFAASGLLGLLVLFATVDLGLGAPGFGILLAALAASAAAGGFVAPSVGERIGVRAGLALGLVGAGAALAVAALVADPGKPWQASLALGVSAGSGMVSTVLVRARLQLAVGPAAAPSAIERLHLATWSAIPIGALVAGWAARQAPVHRVLVGLAVVWAVAAVAALAADGAASEAGAMTLRRPAREIV